MATGRRYVGPRKFGRMFCCEGISLTPLAVIDRYLQAVAQDPLDADLFAELLGLDAELLGSWLVLLGGPADPAEFARRLTRLAPPVVQELAVSQVLAALSVVDGPRAPLEPWRNALVASHLADALGEALQVRDASPRWRVLLGLAGIDIPDDGRLAEFLAFRGAGLELLEDADPSLRIFAVVDALDLLDPGPAQAAARVLLEVEPRDFQAALRTAESRARRGLLRLDLELRLDDAAVPDGDQRNSDAAFGDEGSSLTPLAVVDRYLDAIVLDPLDVDQFVELIGLDGDLLGRWLLLLGGPADPAELRRRLAQISPALFKELAASQALAVLTVSGGARVGLEPWRNSFTASFLAETLAEALDLPEVSARWRVLLGLSGISLPDDERVAELLAFRGARVELLEDADPLLRIFAVVEGLDVLDPEPAQRAAQLLLDVEPLVFQSALRAAESRARQALLKLHVELDQEFERGERLWLRLRIGLLARLFSDASPDPSGWARVADLHASVARMLFTSGPRLFLIDQSAGRLQPVDGQGPSIALDSGTSVIARSARLGERVEFYDQLDASVADRQVLRLLRADAAVCLPVSAAHAQPVLGVLLFALTEDAEDEFAMALYGRELARHLAAGLARQQGEEQAVQRFRQREEQRLRELVHEVNNPLSIVQNYLHILQLTLTVEPKAVEQLRLISTELRRVSDLLGQVRQVPDVADGGTERRPEPRDVDLNGLVARLVEMHRGYAQDRGAEISALLPPAALWLKSDEQRIAQILTNLMRNALEADRDHSVRVEVLAGAFREGREGVLLLITDTGPGLPREVLERLGAPQRSSKGGDHTGLGLHLAHRLVAELSGSIDVRTAPGAGTTFTVFLPLEP